MLNIVCECFVDTKVAEMVTQTATRFNHQHSCGDVAKELQTKLKDRIALGIIDEDKNKGSVPRYFHEFSIVKSTNALILKKHKEKPHYLILICPEMEKWLLNDALAVGIKPSDFNLSDSLKGLISISKIENINNNVDFYRFVKALIKAEAPSLTLLKQWIELFKNNQFQHLEYEI